MRVFIDCGAFVGDALWKFRAGTTGDVVMHAFEPNRHLDAKYPVGTIVHNEAVWIEDGEIDLYFSKRGKCRSVTSVMKNKTSGHLNKKKPEKVPCVDFSKWLLNHFDADDEITLKMDIEGAEYKVLRKMIDDGSIGLVNRVYVEFHVHKMDMDFEKHRALVKEVMALDSLQLFGDYLPSLYHPERANIEWYLK